MKPVTITWTLEDSRQACAEGWDIFDCSGRYEIEKNDEHPGKCKDMTDDEIVVWLMGRAVQGNQLATKAMLHLLIVDPNWTAADISSMTKRGFLVARDANKKVVKAVSTVEYRKS